MRIAFITYEYPSEIGLGGIGTYTKQAAHALRKEGLDISVFCGSLTNQKFSNNNGVNVFSVKCTNPETFKINVVKPFIAEHSKLPFDLIESPEIHGNAIEIKRILPSLALVVRLHAPNYLVEQLKKSYTPFKIKLRFFLGALRRGNWDLGFWRKYNPHEDPDFQITELANAVVAPSNAMKQWVVEHWKLQEKSVTVIPNLFYPDNAFIEINRPTSIKIVVFFGRLNVLKGMVCATKAMKVFLAKNPDWHWKIIGDDGPSHILDISMRQWMKEQLKNVVHQVEFLDGISYSRLPSELAQANFALLPSLFESFSYTCKEALAAGLPVIGSNIGGMRDIIKPGLNGYLVNPKSEREILKAVIRLASDNEIKEKQNNSRASVIEENSSGLIKEYINFYAKTISKNNYPVIN